MVFAMKSSSVFTPHAFNSSQNFIEWNGYTTLSCSPCSIRVGHVSGEICCVDESSAIFSASLLSLSSGCADCAAICLHQYGADRSVIALTSIGSF